MKTFRLYNTYVNNYAGMKLGLRDFGIDYNEMAIFDFIQNAILAEKCEKLEDEYGSHYWISHRLIINGLYFLTLNSQRALINKINKLIKAGLLEKHPECEKIRRTYYRLGPNYESMVSYGENTKDDE